MSRWAVTKASGFSGKLPAKLQPCRDVPRVRRAVLVAQMTERVLVWGRTVGKYRKPTAEMIAHWFAVHDGVKIDRRTAGKWMGPMRAIGRRMRQSRRSAMSARSARYLRECAERGVEPGSLAGVDHRNW
jgi:hypothetical protein